MRKENIQVPAVRGSVLHRFHRDYPDLHFLPEVAELYLEKIAEIIIAIYQPVLFFVIAFNGLFLL